MAINIEMMRALVRLRMPIAANEELASKLEDVAPVPGKRRDGEGQQLGAGLDPDG